MKKIAIWQHGGECADYFAYADDEEADAAFAALKAAWIGVRIKSTDGNRLDTIGANGNRN
jgi:hypothetical protein